MIVFTLTPYLADEMPHSWDLTVPQDALVDVNLLHKTIPATIRADSVHEALDAVFKHANIGEEGWAALYREERNRSLSIGDVVEVRSDQNDVISFWMVMSMGFEEVGSEHVRDLLTTESWYRGQKRKDREEAEAS